MIYIIYGDGNGKELANYIYAIYNIPSKKSQLK